MPEIAVPTRWVALLRGVNVAGVKLSMAAVRQGLEAAGYAEVQTYIQSGNVLFSRAGREAQVRDEIQAHLAAIAGFDVPVVLRTGAQLAAVVTANPFIAPDVAPDVVPDVAPAMLHVLFLPADPGAGALDDLDLAAFAPERCALIGREIYLYLPNGMGRAKLPARLVRHRVGAVGTARNWNSVTKLAALAAG